MSEVNPHDFKNNLFSIGWKFRQYEAPELSDFDRLFDIFKELLIHTSGDFDETISWMRILDKEYEFTTPEYSIDDFVEDLLKRQYVKPKSGTSGDGEGMGLTGKMERTLRQHALEQIFGSLKRSGAGNHSTNHSGAGDESSGDQRAFQFGDAIDKIAMTESLKNAQKNHNGDDWQLDENDLVIEENYFKAQMSTVLMIDISHSMILYGEDRITPAKKVAMALSELIATRYPKDTLDIIVFGNDAWSIEVKDLPYLQVGPFHTNTVAGLQLAMDILRRKKNTNKQIFMITDGKPSCVIEHNGEYYKNSNGLDEYIVDQCYSMAQRARRLHIPITTFMIAQDSYLQQFVDEFTAANGGKAIYTGINGLGDMIFTDYEKNRRKRLN
jgi:Ca-activated chloride channel family protein